MRLSWNEIRARAARFADEWKNAHYERGESQTFYNEFFEVFGVTRRRVATFEEPVRRLGNQRGFIDLFWKGMLLVEHKSVGRDLNRAREKALDYFPGLKEHELPRYILVSDFQNFELHELEDGTTIRFTLRQLPEHVEDFGFILGVQKHTFRDQDPVNIEAATEQQRAKIRSLAQAVLDARAQFPNANLADLYDVDAMPLYDVDAMPLQLRKAHHAVDKAVDKLYRPAAFGGDRDRVEHLFGLYEKIVAPLVVAAAQPTTWRGRRLVP